MENNQGKESRSLKEVAAQDGLRLLDKNMGNGSQTSAMLALFDLWVGITRWRLWILLGWQDIRQRYRRSLLGPFWLTLSMAIMVGALSLLYGALFSLSLNDYLPFLCLGFIVWGLISGIVTDGCVVFIGSEAFIKQISLPLSVYVYRLIWRNLIIFGHNMVVFIVVACIFSIWPSWSGLLLLPGLILNCATGIWVCLLLGLISARFRDVPQLVASFIQVAFFLTPIIWKPELLGDRFGIVDFNPFYHFVEIIRQPMLGNMPDNTSWLVTICITVLGWILTFLIFSRFRGRIAYWI